MIAAAQHDDDELAFIRDPELFGDLVEHPEFTEPYLAALRSFRGQGARATIQAAVDGTLA